MRRLRFSVIVNREYNEVMPLLPKYEQMLLTDQGSYAVEPLGSQTRITFTSHDPIRPVYSLDPTGSPLHTQMRTLSQLKESLEIALPDRGTHRALLQAS